MQGLRLPLFVLLMICSACVFSTAKRLCHGDISKLHPTGKQVGGVKSSYRDASQDVNDFQRLRTCYEAVADAYCIQAAVIAGVASRESRGGRVLNKTHGWGDHGHAWGILQCDIYTSDLPCTSCAWDSCCHINMMVGRQLVPYVEAVAAKFPSWRPEQQIQGGVAAYNFGVSNVRSWSHLDIGTAHNDYSNDAIARAQFLQQHGWQ